MLVNDRIKQLSNAEQRELRRLMDKEHKIADRIDESVSRVIDSLRKQGYDA